MSDKQTIGIYEVLAGAYKGKGADLAVCLTHAAQRTDGTTAPLCRIPAESLLEATDRETREAAPTCPTCARKWRALLTREQKINRMAGAMARAEGWIFAEDLDFAASDSPRAGHYYALACAAMGAL